MTKRLKRGPTRLQGEGDVINFIMQRDETPLAVSGVDTGRLATVCIPGGTGTNCTFDKIYKEEFLEMKNLKKVLALVLAMSTVFGLSVSAGAAATDFNDYDEIGNKEAVEVMNALNVIGGNDKGEFNPDGYLTRAEMCKMVSYVMNGGKAPVLSTSATPTYTDIKGHWGEAYIEYATSMGIVGGVGGGKFAPDSTLTGTQAAKMMLTAMGYDATVFGFGGTGWDTNVNRYANEAGLYDELGSLQPNLPITRDDAAQLMYNAMQATMMKRSWTLNPATGEQTESYTPWLDNDTVEGGATQTVPHTLLADKYKGAIGYAYMSGYDYDSVKKEWTYDFTRSASFGGNAITNNAIGTSGTTLTTGDDYTALYGQRVKVIYNVKDSKVVYGVYPSDSSVIATGASGEIDMAANTKTVDINGTTYKLSNTGEKTETFNERQGRVGAYDTNSDTSLYAMKDSKNAFTFELVDNNGDGKGDAVIYHPLTVAQITYVGKDTITLNKQVDGKASQNIDDISIYDGYAKGDWVYVTKDDYATKDIHTFEKAELKSGTVAGFRDDNKGTRPAQYQIDGKWYTVADAANVTDMRVGDTVNYVACGSKLFFAEITDLGATTRSIGMVVTAAEKKVESGIDKDKTSVEAKLLLADGSTKVVTVSKVDGQDATVDNTTALIGKLFTYHVKSGDYELKTVNKDNKAGYSTVTASTNGYDNGKIGGVDLADDALVFVYDRDGSTSGVAAGSKNSGKVFTGREIKNEFGNKKWGQDSLSMILTADVNGYTYVKAAVIINDANTEMPGITLGSNYGYLTENAYQSYEDGKTYLNFTMYTSAGVVTAKQENTEDPSVYRAGNVITYDVVSDGVIKNVNEITSSSKDPLNMGVVTGVSKNSVQISTNLKDVDAAKGSYKLNDDTRIIYVDSNKTAGAEGGSISIGQLYKDDKDNNKEKAYAYNVRFMVNDSDTVVLLIVDVNNDFGTDDAVRPGVE